MSVKQLAEDFARYLYLPRLREPAVLVGAVIEGIALLTWPQDSFAFADSFDEQAGRYRGLRSGRNISLSEPDSPALLVKPDIARKQLDAESSAAPPATTSGGVAAPGGELAPAI